MRIFNFLRLLLDPAPADGGTPSARGPELMDAATMGDVFARLNLPAELMGEQPKPAAKAKADPKAAAVDPNAEPAVDPDADPNAEPAVDPNAEPAVDPDADPNAEPAVDPDADPNADPEAVVPPEFTAEQQAFIDEAKAALDTELATFKQQAETATARVAELEQQLRTAPQEVAAVHPLFLVDDAKQIAKREGEIASFEKWALANWDGTDAVEAKGDQPAVPAYSAEQVRERYAQLVEERKSLIPQAREYLAARGHWDQLAKQEYPKLADPKSEDFKIAESILRQAPGLKAVFPNIKVMIGDALVGEKIRLQKARARKATGKAAVKPAPKLPVKPAPGARSTLAPKAKTGGEISTAKFRELGGTRDALVEMIGKSSLVN